MAAQILREEGQSISVWKIQRLSLPVVNIAHRWALDFKGRKAMCLALLHHEGDVRGIGSFMTHDFNLCKRVNQSRHSRKRLGSHLGSQEANLYICTVSNITHQTCEHLQEWALRKRRSFFKVMPSRISEQE